MRKTCLNEVYALAQSDSRVVFIGSDIGAGTLSVFKKEIPERFFMEGISEQHLVGMMAGLAMEGKIPYMNTIATFMTRRCFEQILLDAGLHHLPLRFIGSGGGVVYAPLGPTHCALEDIAILRTIPNMTILAPCDADEMRRVMPLTLNAPGPVYIRLAKGGDRIVSRGDLPFRIGRGIVLREGKDILLVTTGITAAMALDAAEMLGNKGMEVCVFHNPTLKPFDKEGLEAEIQSKSLILSIEEHTVVGGLGSIVSEVIAEGDWNGPKKLIRMGFEDQFPEQYGNQESLMRHHGISADHIVEKVQHALKRTPLAS